MQNQTLQITKWPFYVANFILNIVAVLLVVCVPSFSVGMALLFVLTAGLGAALLAIPFLMEYRARVEAYAIEMRSRAGVNEAKFEEWARDLKEQTEYLSRLTEQIENNMYATEGMVRRADRKLMALEKFESKMDQVLGGVSAGELSTTSMQYSSLRSVENEPLFAQASGLSQGNDLDVALFHGGGDAFDGEFRGDDVNSSRVEDASAMKVMYAEDSDMGESFELENEHDIEEEDGGVEPLVIALDSENDDSLALESDEALPMEVEDVESEEEEVNHEEAQFVKVEEEVHAPKVRVSTKASGRKRKSAAKKDEEMTLFPEEEEGGGFLDASGGYFESAKDFEVGEEAVVERKVIEVELSEGNVRVGGYDDASAGAQAPESAYTITESRAGETVVVVNVMIGLGNKPFIRGAGGELSWEKGVAMEFLEIGKWGYTIRKPSRTIEFRIFKNDKEADAYVYNLKVGQMIEVSPKFVPKEMSRA
jgi:hypothetical protein